MKKLSTVIILLFIFLTFTSCSKDVALQVPKEETPITEEDNQTNSPEVLEVDSKDETIIEDTTSPIETEEETSPQTETPISNEDTTTSLVPNITASEPVTEYYYSFGLLHEISSPYDNPYIIVDEAEFLIGDEAREEVLKRGLGYFDDDGIYVYPPGYYIRNNYDILTEYPISENCTYYLSSWIIQDYLGKEVPIGLSSDSYEVSFEEFNQIVELEDFTFNTWFECEDGYVVKLYHQFTP